MSAHCVTDIQKAVAGIQGWHELAFRAMPRPVPVLPSLGQPRVQDVPVPWPALSQLSLLRCEFRKFAPQKSSITPAQQTPTPRRNARTCKLAAGTASTGTTPASSLASIVAALHCGVRELLLRSLRNLLHWASITAMAGMIEAPGSGFKCLAGVGLDLSQAQAAVF